MRPKTCFTYLGWSFLVITISKKIRFGNFDFELPKVKNYISNLWRGPIHQAIIGGNSHFASLARV